MISLDHHAREGASALEIITIGIDLAKNVFQVHGVDDAGKIVVRRALRRKEMLGFFGKLAPCLVGMEACATAASLGARTRSTGPRGEADAARLCEVLRQAQQERHC